jgi:Uma2 family endonuclease
VQVSPSRFRVPDVTILDRNQPAEQIITRPPLAVFEVLSPEDTLQRLLSKLDDYAAMGILQIWVVHPQDAACYRYDERQLLRAETFALPANGIEFQMSRIGELLD